VLSANIARKLDPQLAAVYWSQMVQHGAHHQKAVCVVATRLAERSWAVMARGERYVIRDLDGRQMSPVEAKAIIAKRYTVPDEERARRATRRRQTRRTPHQVL
jgi:methyltransferase-like protein